MAKRKRKGAPEPRDRGIFVTMNGSEVLAINQGTKGRIRDRWIVKTLLAELDRENRDRLEDEQAEENRKLESGWS